MASKASRNCPTFAASDALKLRPRLSVPVLIKTQKHIVFGPHLLEPSVVLIFRFIYQLRSRYPRNDGPPTFNPKFSDSARVFAYPSNDHEFIAAYDLANVILEVFENPVSGGTTIWDQRATKTVSYKHWTNN